MRLKQLVILSAICSFSAFVIAQLQQPLHLSNLGQSRSSTSHGSPPPANVQEPSKLRSKAHPIHNLITDAEIEFNDLNARQSQTLAGAVRVYRQRYKIHPPPNFDKWFEYAKSRDVRLIDEYDTIYHSLLPFWGLPSSVIRGRAKEALGFRDNALISLLIRSGQAISISGGSEWQQKATLGMIENFVRYLPDMDIAFNIHDEPRVVVPHDDLDRLVRVAKDQAMPAAALNQAPRNAWSPRPPDVDDGKRFNEVKTTKFNIYAHQPTWLPSRLSCSPESAARSLNEQPTDDVRAYATSELGFVFNKTAFSDVCLSPSLQRTYGFFDRPNVFNVVHDLFPIFSQSKLSSFQDILYPSPWYWAGRVTYEEDKDVLWEEKKDQMYWRGSTTGGFSRDGGWRRQHRQRFVRKINALGTAYTMENTTSDGWGVSEVNRQDYKDLFNVTFSHVGQCDPGDCDAQREFFNVVEYVPPDDAWNYKYLVDIDGNAFSGRFYAFLRSKSLIYKVALFREWHEEWIKPWVHYIPLSLKGEDYLESIRYFNAEQEGIIQALKMMMQGREWANKVLRNEDMEAWFFRLLLE